MLELIGEKECFCRLRGFSSTYADEPEEILLGDRMYFSSVLCQDDIFEGRPKFVWDTALPDKAHLTAFAKRMAPKQTPLWIEDTVDRFHARIQDPIERGIIQGFMAYDLEQIYKGSSICCFLSNPFNQALWASYAGSGTGFGLLFDFTKPWHVSLVPDGSSVKAAPFKIDYVDPLVRPAVRLSFFRPTIEDGWDDIKKGLLTKARFWEWQEESRIARLGVGPSHASINPRSLAAVFLGYNISQVNRDRVVSLVKQRRIPVPIYKTLPSASAYALELRRVDY